MTTQPERSIDEIKLEAIKKELNDWDGHRFKDEVAKAILTSLNELELKNHG